MHWVVKEMELSAPAGVPHLRVVYRSYGGENSKQRPSYYSKLLALSSLIRAVDALDSEPELVFVNDGPIAAPLLALMEARGEVLPVPGGSNRRSYRAMIGLEAFRGGAENDVVWFAEDDYLYRLDAMRHLVAGATVLPQADYFALSGSESLDTATSRRRPAPRPESGADGDPHAMMIEGVTWFRALSATSTFGVRLQVLREDARLLRMCPFTGGAWDTTTCLVFQGYQPFSAAQLRTELLPGAALPLGQWPRSVVRGLIRGGINLRALRRPSRRRVLLGSDPEFISHMEAPELDPRTPPSLRTAAVDWERVATDTAAWTVAQGIPIAPLTSGEGVAGR